LKIASWNVHGLKIASWNVHGLTRNKLQNTDFINTICNHDGLGLHIGGSRKLSSLSKHEVFEQLLQTLNGERMQNYLAM